jgi:hypothetical protein
MKSTKITGLFIMILLIGITLNSYDTYAYSGKGEIGPIYGDYIIEERTGGAKKVSEGLQRMFSSVIGPEDTSSYFIGDISVTVIFPESNESSSNTENWTDTEIAEVKAEIQDGLNWWAQREPNAHISFNINYEERVPTDLEPIEGPGAASQAARCWWNMFEKLSYYSL